MVGKFRMFFLFLFLTLAYNIYILIKKSYHFIYYTVIKSIIANYKYILLFYVVPTATLTLTVSYLLVQSMRSHSLINTIYRIQQK